MPVYEYECLKCGTRFEEIRKFSDPPVKKHTGCGGRVKRLLSAPAFHFKGTGWYVTDYANKNKKDPGSSHDAEKKADAKSDAAKSGASGKTDSSAKTDASAKTESGSKSDSAGKSDGGAKSSKSSEKVSKS